MKKWTINAFLNFHVGFPAIKSHVGSEICEISSFFEGMDAFQAVTSQEENRLAFPTPQTMQ